MKGIMQGLHVGHWLISTANFIPDITYVQNPWKAGYGFLFYSFSSIYFRFVLLAGAKAENYGIDEDEL